MELVTQDVLQFFDRRPDALPIYEAFARRVMQEIPEVRVRVKKSQISFYTKHLFACVSFAAVRKAKDRPPVWLVVTLGLARRLDTPRADAVTEPYPGRWTHHFLLSGPEDVDDELLGWTREAAAFANAKSNSGR